MKRINFWRAAGIAALNYAAGFMSVLVISVFTRAYFPDVKMTDSFFLYSDMMVALVLTPLFTFWYFRSKAVPANPDTGFIFGKMLVVVFLLMDAFMLLPAILLGAPLGATISAYKNPLLWISVLELLVIPALLGDWMKKGYFGKRA